MASGVLFRKDGYLVHTNILIRPIAALGRRKMSTIHGIVVHQTGGTTLAGALNSAAQKQGVGAHFYIDKDGTIVQVASLDFTCGHVGLLKPRCMVEHRCKPDQARMLSKMKPRDISKLEYQKDYPERFPGNADSVGIELVGYYHAVKGKKEPEYDSITSEQQVALKWIVNVICSHKGVRASEIYRHPDVSWKNPSEAASAKW
ncbi:peptidoglycan recognition protein family protein [Holophaga foetida]|uniref:peptidoglycan recognition protein family protein n=1 Tax=Holophaga foetida TaxID=35839 RepID=UPI0002473B28|nr:peptidoglycan recognition family protein [Holophaga foetida]